MSASERNRHKRRSRRKLTLTILVVFALSASLSFAGGATESISPTDEALAPLGVKPVSVPLPDFGLIEHLSKGPLDLSTYRESLMLLNFWAIWCEPCKLEMPSMENLYRRYKSERLVVLAVNFREDPATVASFITEYPFIFPVAFDPHGKIGERLGVRVLPTTYVISPAGQIVGSKVGTRYWDTPEVYDAIEILLEAEWTLPQLD